MSGSLQRIGGTAAAGGYPALVAPTVTEGVIQREADGTTSATITVSAASDGSGSYTYSMGTLNKPGGDGALLSAGVPPRTYNLTNMSDGGTYVVYGTVTDDTTGQVVGWSHTVVVADPGSASWTAIDTLAVADLADAGPFTSGTNNADYDGETIAVTTVRNGDTGNVEFIQNTGIVITSVGGTITAALYLNDRIPSWARAYSMVAPIAVHVPIDITFSGTTDNGVVVGFNDRATHNNGEFRGCRLRWKSASSEQFQTRIGSTDYNVGGAGDPPDPTFVLTCILHAGVIMEVMRTSGTTPPTPTPGSGTAVTSGGDTVAQQASTIPYDDFYLIVNAVFNAVVTVGQLQIVRWQ